MSLVFLPVVFICEQQQLAVTNLSRKKSFWEAVHMIVGDLRSQPAVGIQAHVESAITGDVPD